MITAYEVSAVIYNCDKKEVLPNEVAELLIEIYEDELKETNLKKQYDRSIEMQAKAREEMKKDLPGFAWVNN